MNNDSNKKKDKGYTSIRISDEVKSKLQSMGHLGESYSECINRLVSQRLVYERIPYDGDSSNNSNSSSDLGRQELRI